MCLFPQNRVVTKRDMSQVVVTTTCGKCVECLKKRQNDWKLRIMHESKYWKYLYFFTLTYRDAALPCVVTYDDCSEILYEGRLPDCDIFCSRICSDLVIRSTVNKYDVQKFFKRLRTNFERDNGYKLQMKYFVCSEYGPNPAGTKRPHYHGVIMCDEPYHLLRKEFVSWRDDYGRMEFKQVGTTRADKSKVANYIGKYCCKGQFASRKEEISDGFVSPTWYSMSKSIGQAWIIEHSRDWMRYIPDSVRYNDTGVWDVEQVRAMYNAAPALPVWSQIDILIENLKVFDGDGKNIYKYSMPRYYFENLFCIKKTYYDLQTQTKRGRPFVDLRISPEIQWSSVCCSSCRAGGADERAEIGRLRNLRDYGFRGQYYICSPSRLPFFTYKTVWKKTTRFVHENWLSCAIAFRMDFIASFKYAQRLSVARQNDSTLSDSALVRQLAACDRRSYKYRKLQSEAKLRNFYDGNMWTHREFDFIGESGFVDTNII